MTTRRNWLKAAAGLSTASLWPVQAAESLKSRAAEARPITASERRQRLAQAQRLMHEQRLDAIAITGGTSLDYFTGVRWWNSERLFAMILPQRGEPFFVSPGFEEERAREQLKRGLDDARMQVLTWQEDDDPYARVAAGAKERGIVSGRMGIEETVRFVFADGIAKALPAITIASATPVTAGCRMRKSAHEIELMRLACSVTLQAYEWAWRQLHEGMTQQEFSGLIAAAYAQIGFPGEPAYRWDRTPRCRTAPCSHK